MLKLNAKLYVTSASVMLITGLAFAQTKTTNKPTAATADEYAADVIAKLHHTNQMEIELGKLAQQKAKSEQVRAYGKRLVTDHTKAEKDVKATADKLRVEVKDPTPKTDDEKIRHQAQMQTEKDLKSAQGAEFDHLYIAAMSQDHANDIKMVTEAKEKVQNPEMKKLLTKLLPTLKQHEAQAQKIHAKLGAAHGANEPKGEQKK